MSTKKTAQVEFWSGNFGAEYTNRNPQSMEELEKLYEKDYGVHREKMNKEFLKGIPKDARILEVGANMGLQLEMLRKQGFKNLLGIEVNRHAIEHAKKIHPHVDIIEGSAFDLPFMDKRFDLVFTSGVLIHIAPKDLPKAIKEIVRVSKKYVWGFEYFADKPTEIDYRGNKGFLWKRNFCELYQKTFPKLRLVKEKKYKMLGSNNVTQMYLLKK